MIVGACLSLLKPLKPLKPLVAGVGRGWTLGQRAWQKTMFHHSVDTCAVVVRALPDAHLGTWGPRWSVVRYYLFRAAVSAPAPNFRVRPTDANEAINVTPIGTPHAQGKKGLAA